MISYLVVQNIYSILQDLFSRNHFMVLAELKQDRILAACLGIDVDCFDYAFLSFRSGSGWIMLNYYIRGPVNCQRGQSSSKRAKRRLMSLDCFFFFCMHDVLHMNLNLKGNKHEYKDLWKSTGLLLALRWWWIHLQRAGKKTCWT